MKYKGELSCRAKLAVRVSDGAHIIVNMRGLVAVSISPRYLTYVDANDGCTPYGMSRVTVGFFPYVSPEALSET